MWPNGNRILRRPKHLGRQFRAHARAPARILRKYHRPPRRSYPRVRSTERRPRPLLQTHYWFYVWLSKRRGRAHGARLSHRFRPHKHPKGLRQIHGIPRQEYQGSLHPPRHRAFHRRRTPVPRRPLYRLHRGKSRRQRRNPHRPQTPRKLGPLQILRLPALKEQTRSRGESQGSI